MSTNSIIGQTGKIVDIKKKPSKDWRSTLISINALLFLGFAIETLQSMNKSFAFDRYKLDFIENWIPWLSILCFALGWLLTHWVEIALSKNQPRIAKLLYTGFFVIYIFIPGYLWFVSDNDVLQHFSRAAFLLVYSGHFLRYSAFQQENRLRLGKYLNNPSITIESNIITANYVFSYFKTPTNNVCQIDTKTEYLDNFVFTPPNEYEYVQLQIPAIRYIHIFGFKFGSKLISGFRVDGLDDLQKEELRKRLMVEHS